MLKQQQASIKWNIARFLKEKHKRHKSFVEVKQVIKCCTLISKYPFSYFIFYGLKMLLEARRYTYVNERSSEIVFSDFWYGSTRRWNRWFISRMNEYNCCILLYKICNCFSKLLIYMRSRGDFVGPYFSSLCMATLNDEL